MPDDLVASLSEVARTYGGVRVLDDVSIDFEPGVTAVVGPNGSGKSTLQRILVGATEPTAGEVRYPGATGPKPIGYLPQRVPFRDGFTARETLAFYARLVDDDPDAALERVGLVDAGGRRVEALSGGMRRLLGIAQAVLGDPSLVVLDEPASGLDPGMRERAFRAAARRADGDTAVVVSSHALDLVDAHADRVVILGQGRVAAAGALDRLLEERDVADASELYRAVIESTGARASDEGDAGDGGGGDGDPTEGDGEREESDDAERDVHVTGVSDR
ncbi:ABC transporter ATP-binding protein [Halorubrum sp. CBA1229]|uniref:ABC transporter ATP-binding protein n=1 Tax=Halorubrum sp. CBA1229 TaxID=1853699 RepID=UPI000F3F7203|nr:ABC transporter ATP-binding protein [Halorubrum sp. CBA1229]QKY17905.1 ABC transporter ATP-binding protein [Halorubrum sp. CBA1229]